MISYRLPVFLADLVLLRHPHLGNNKRTNRNMKSNVFILLLLLSQLFLFGQSPQIKSEQYRQDFNYFWTTINDEYCYFQKKQTSWQKVKEIYTPLVDTITNRDQFVTLLEKALYEIYDHHAILNTNTGNSQRLVPSGADIWAEWVDGKPVITEVRRGFGAEVCGIIAGMEIVAVNDIAVKSAVNSFLPRALNPITNEAKSFALRLVLAGNHTQPRKISLKHNGTVKDFFPDKTGLLLEHINYPAKIESKSIGNIGYIKINDCLYDNELIPAFDNIMQTFKNAKSIILDLRETPSGGNTSVARAIIGWFIDKEHFYQKHEYYAEEKSSGIKRSWEEIVSPRKGKYYDKPLVILCNHWTGSIGEGMVIGFDALKRPETKIIGTEMARLNGAVYSFEMPFSKIRFTLPNERLYHINGLPREQYVPPVFIDWRKGEEKPGFDLFMAMALEYLKNK
jgi:C-terminal processing protease CtpA/Prc